MCENGRPRQARDPEDCAPLDRRGPNHQLPKKIRVYELARELGLTNKEALDLCVDLGIGVKSHSSSIEDAQADRARRKADRDGLRRAVQPEEPASSASGGASARPGGAFGIAAYREHAGRRASRRPPAGADTRACSWIPRRHGLAAGGGCSRRHPRASSRANASL